MQNNAFLLPVLLSSTRVLTLASLIEESAVSLIEKNADNIVQIIITIRMPTFTCGTLPLGREPLISLKKLVSVSCHEP